MSGSLYAGQDGAGKRVFDSISQGGDLMNSFFLANVISPHVTNEIRSWIEKVSKIPVDESGEEPDVCIVYQTSFSFVPVSFLEAWRIGGYSYSLVPDMHGEQKT